MRINYLNKLFIVVVIGDESNSRPLDKNISELTMFINHMKVKIKKGFQQMDFSFYFSVNLTNSFQYVILVFVIH